MSTSSTGEFAFIDSLRRALPPLPPQEGIGIGDDAAFLGNLPGGILLSTDLSVEGVHFRTDWSSPEEFVDKAFVSNLSDVNAMGGTPEWILLGLGIPAGAPDSLLPALREAVSLASRRRGATVVGGDVVRAPALTLSIAVAGRPGRRILRRAGARPGEAVYVSGPLGLSRAGLELLESGEREGRTDFEREALKRHRTPEYPAGWGPALAADERTGACIDVSDGLFSEANHLAGDSGVRIVLDEELLPVPEGLEEFARGRGLDPVELVGSSGEEYQLLFTSSASPGDFESILEETASRGALRRIGVVERGSGVCLRRRDGSVAAVGATGWSHF